MVSYTPGTPVIIKRSPSEIEQPTPFHRLPAHRDALYLRHVRAQPCCVFGFERGRIVVAHHVRIFGAGGMGLKPSDYLTVPLHCVTHRELHDMPEAAFWERAGIDPADEIRRLMESYLRLNILPVDVYKGFHEAQLAVEEWIRRNKR